MESEILLEIYDARPLLWTHPSRKSEIDLKTRKELNVTVAIDFIFPLMVRFQVSNNKDIITRLKYNINLLQQYILEELCAWERPENADGEVEITRRPTFNRSVSRKSTIDPSPSLEQSNSRKSEVLSPRVTQPSFGRSISRKVTNEPIEKKTTTSCAFVNELFQSLSRSPRFISSLFCYQSAKRAKKDDRFRDPYYALAEAAENIQEAVSELGALKP